MDNDGLTIFFCEHLDDDEAPEWRAVRLGEHRVVAMCQKCTERMEMETIQSRFTDVIRAIVRSELAKALRHAA